MRDLDPPLHLARPTWILAALGAIAMHAACAALALASMARDQPAEELGAPAIEIGIALTTQRHDPTGLPVGPDTQASVASPARVEQQKVDKPSDLPKAVPTETDDPDRLVSPHDDKPQDDDPRPATQESHASKAAIAAEETAAPTIEAAVQAPRSAAPADGTGESARRDLVSWQKELAAHFNKYKRYPLDRSMQRAEVVVGFVLDRTGHVLSSGIVTGSGDSSFDAAALDMVRHADPVPPPPPLVADQGLTFSLPVIFHVKGKD
jgi:protein TonB